MKILVAGATAGNGLHVMNTGIKMGHQPVALIRNRCKVKLPPGGTDKNLSLQQNTSLIKIDYGNRL